MTYSKQKASELDIFLSSSSNMSHISHKDVMVFQCKPPRNIKKMGTQAASSAMNSACHGHGEKLPSRQVGHVRHFRLHRLGRPPQAGSLCCFPMKMFTSNPMTDPNGAARKMVCHGYHQQKNPINVSINIPAPWIRHGNYIIIYCIILLYIMNYYDIYYIITIIII